MRKTYIPLVVIILLAVVGCQQQGKNQLTEENTPLVALVDSYMKDHPNYLNNDITKEEGDKYFQKIIVDTTKNYLAGIPLKLQTLNKNGEEYVAQFYCWGREGGYEFKSPVHSLHCDVITVVPDSLVQTLKEGDCYLLDGCVIERIANLQVMEELLGKSTTAITPLFGIREDDIYRDKYEVNLGLLYFHLEGIKKYNGTGL